MTTDHENPAEGTGINRRQFGSPALAAGVLLAAAGPSLGQEQSARGSSRGRIHAEDFGAAGDGMRDDSIGIQKAINVVDKAGGGIVLLGNRTYRIDAPLEINPTRVSLSGARATLDARRIPAGRSCILVRTREGSPRYDQAPQFIEGLVIQGAGAAARQTGIAFSTPVPDLSSRIVLRNLSVKDVATGIDFGARTYLCQSYSLQIAGVEIAVLFSSNEDAGENISFYGCTFGNTSGVAIVNASGAMAGFYGCSFDYCRRWFSGSGLNQFHGCWFEKQRTGVPEDVPFELISGNLDFFGGGIQISGNEFEKGNASPHMFVAKDKLARITIDRTFAWNWRTATGELVGGDGSISILGVGGQGRKHIAPVVKNDDRHNLFGPAARLEGKDIGLSCWVNGDGANRNSAFDVAWGKARGSVSTAKMSNGKGCLRIAKGTGRGTPFTFDMLAPAVQGRGATLRLAYLLSSRSTDTPMWFQVAFVQVVGHEGDGIPRIGNRLVWGETALRPEAKGAGAWRQLVYNSQDLDQTAPMTGYAPAWCTHLHLTANMVSLDTDTELLIAEPGAWLL